MKGQTEERWRQLCEQAVDEHDPVKFMELIDEINRVLGAKEERLTGRNAAAKKKGAS